MRKKKYFNNLDLNKITDNKLFGKQSSLFFQAKVSIPQKFL